MGPGQGTHSHRGRSPPNTGGLQPGFQLPTWKGEAQVGSLFCLRPPPLALCPHPLPPTLCPLPLPLPLALALPPAPCPLPSAPCSPALFSVLLPAPGPHFGRIWVTALHKGRWRQGGTQGIWLTAQLLRTGVSPGVWAQRPRGQPSGGAPGANELPTVPPGWA